jgi:hypothetical protein
MSSIRNNLAVFLAVFVTLLATAGTGFAKGVYQNDNELRLIQSVTVEMNDDTSDGCLQQPETLKTEAELIFRRSGITVNGEPTYAQGEYYLFLSAFGHEAHSVSNQSLGCVVTLGIELYRLARVPEGYTAYIEAYMARFIFFGGHGIEMENKLRIGTNQGVTDLANEVLKVRGK